MGFFSSTKNNTASFPWIELVSIDQLTSILKNSENKPVLLFKHSTRCSISSMALNRFENEWDKTNDSVDLYYLDLLNYRDVSNEIASATNVVHQSPQAIVIKNNEVIYEASHNSISAKNIQSLLTN